MEQQNRCLIDETVGAGRVAAHIVKTAPRTREIPGEEIQLSEQDHAIADIRLNRRVYEADMFGAAEQQRNDGGFNATIQCFSHDNLPDLGPKTRRNNAPGTGAMQIMRLTFCFQERRLGGIWRAKVRT